MTNELDVLAAECPLKRRPSRHYLGWYVHVQWEGGVVCVDYETFYGDDPEMLELRLTPPQEAFNAAMGITK